MLNGDSPPPPAAARRRWWNQLRFCSPSGWRSCRARSPMRCRFVLLALALCLPSTFAAGPKRPLKPEDFASIRDVDEPNLSPDGKSVAYVVGTVDLAKDKQPRNLWLAKWDGSENRALTFGETEQTHPRWSPDGKWLAFLSSRTDEKDNDQLWILSSAGGEAEQLTKEKGSF